MTAARCSHDDEGDHSSQIGGLERRVGGSDRVDPVFQPSCDQVHHPHLHYEPTAVPDRRRDPDRHAATLQISTDSRQVPNEVTLDQAGLQLGRLENLLCYLV